MKDEAEQESEPELVKLNHEVQNHNIGSSHGLDCCLCSNSTLEGHRGRAIAPGNTADPFRLNKGRRTEDYGS